MEREMAGGQVWLWWGRKNVRISMLQLLMPLRRFVQEREGGGDWGGEEEEEDRIRRFSCGLRGNGAEERG